MLKVESDIGTRVLGGVIALLSVAMTVWAWHAPVHNGHFGLKGPILGPFGVAVGTSLVIHGKGGSQLAQWQRLRVYGVAGTAAAIVNLYLMGYFAMPATQRIRWMVFLMFLPWALPARLFVRPSRATTEDSPKEPR